MGKVPVIETEAGALAESQVIVEYLEDAYPQTPLYPRETYARAKCRELIQFMELHVELPARRLYGEVFFGGKASDETKQQVERDLGKGTKAFARLVKFAPYIAGESLTYADCGAVTHLPLVSQATQTIYGRDFLADIAGLKPYLQMMRERPHVKRVNADRKANTEVFLSLRK
jgi:glutathione S-transferase